MHIFKNAGTTIDWVLEKNFGNQSIKWDDANHPANIFTQEQVLDFVESHSDAASISSHQMRFPLPKHDAFLFIPMVFIRHPLDRAFSIYGFSRRDGRQTPFNEKAKSMNLKQFIQYNMDTPELRQMKNSQTAWLSYEARQYDMSGRYTAAMKNLTSCPIMGIVDKLDESLVLAEEVLHNHFPKIDLSFIPQNVSNNRSTLLSANLEVRRLEMGEELWKKLERNNRHDLNLYSLAAEELEKRISRMPDFETRLDNFQRRCRILQANSSEPPTATDKSKSLFGTMKSYFSRK